MYLPQNISLNIKLLIHYFEKYKKELEDGRMNIEMKNNNHILEIMKSFLGNKDVLFDELYNKIALGSAILDTNLSLKEINQNLDTDFDINKIGSIFGRVQENSNIIMVYKLEKKKFYQKQFSDFEFNQKCISMFLTSNNTIYVSGGMDYLRQPTNCFYSFKIENGNDDYKFKYSKLPPMNCARYSHAMTSYQDNFILFISGYNNPTCEVFDINRDVFKSLPSLPIWLPNACLCFINESDLITCGSNPIFQNLGKSYMFKINLQINIQKKFDFFMVDNNIKEEEEDRTFDWITIEVKFETFGKFLRGMNAISISEGLLILGGFDTNYFYDNVYLANFNQEENNTKQICTITDSEIKLPFKTFFNSNYYLLSKNYAILIDGNNCAFELNLATKEIVYYT